MSKSTRKETRNIAYFDMGPWPFYCGVVTSPAAWAREMKRLKVDDHPFMANGHAVATAHWITRPDKAAIGLIALDLPKKKLPDDLLAGRIAHEAMHLLHRLQEWINQGEGLGDEAEAYLIGYIVRECVNAARQRAAGNALVPA